MRCARGCGEMFAGEILWVCGWCGASQPRGAVPPAGPPALVEIPAGRFVMGAAGDDPDGRPHERPSRTITLARYAIALTPTTNGQYLQFVGETGRAAPRHWAARPPVGENVLHPVSFVTWHDAVAYCTWLSEKTGRRYALPTEAQWEKASRGGLFLDGDAAAGRANAAPARRYPSGHDTLGESEANHDGVQGGTTPVGAYPDGASPYGCLDMAGNVSEWCLDRYDPGFFATMPDTDPCCAKGELAVLKGGSWRSEADHARCSNRYAYVPERGSYGIGFRVARVD